jgi:Flp pilus assembly protein TadG
MPAMSRFDIRGLWRDQRGNLAVMFALASAVLFGFGALALDASHLYVVKRQLQGAADAASLAAVLELPDEDAALDEALEYAAKNLPTERYGVVLASGDVLLGQWDASTRTFHPGVSPADAVKVTTRRAHANGNPATTYLARVLGYHEVDVVAQSIAGPGRAPVCLLALEPSAAGVDVGNGTITANGCTVHVNSDHPAEALTGQSNGSVTAESICVNGDHGNKPSYSPTPAECGSTPDPLADLEPPSYAGCDETNYKLTSSDATIDPGVYCGGIEAEGSVTLTMNAGIYVIKNGPFKVAGGASLVGNGVSIYLKGPGASVDVAGAASITLSAPTMGPMAGVLFFADRDLPAGTEHAFKGGGNIHYEGTMYFPTTDFLLVGNGSGTSPSPFSLFIARRFRFNGIGELSINADYDGSAVPVPPGVLGERPRLVM